MSELTEQTILTALQKVLDPQTNNDVVSRNMIKAVKIDGQNVSFTIEFKGGNSDNRETLLEQAKAAVQSAGAEQVTIQAAVNDPLKVISSSPPPGGQPPMQPPTPVAPPPQKLGPKTKYSIAVASGKGGVGKSTVSVNLAVCLAKTGARVGLLDADVYGPNIPIMMGVEAKLGTRNDKIAPLERYGVEMVSVGFISQGDAAVIWRGPLVGRMIQQFLQEVDWSELDYLIVDLPPGTGDAQLTLTQALPLTGAVIVCTPQDVAMADVKKGINMFKKVKVPILGVVENMSYFLCSQCDERTEIFDHGGGKRASKDFKVPFLGEIPLDTKIRVGGDEGIPIVVSEPDSAISEAFRKVADGVMRQVTAKESEDGGFLKRVFKVS